MSLPATIIKIRQETPTIKSFVLDLGENEIGFKSGQWVDFFVTLEGAEAVGGYSITSSPAVQNRIGLAIRRDESDHPVTNWLHSDAKVGDSVEVRLGGDFFYTPDMSDSVVLIGGGIGLTPLMSIVHTVDKLSDSAELMLVYSAATPSELLFRQALEAISERNPRIKNVFTVTGANGEFWSGHTGRIDADLLRSESVDMDALFYICGPPAMIQDMIAMLRNIGLSEDRIRYEQWW